MRSLEQCRLCQFIIRLHSWYCGGWIANNTATALAPTSKLCKSRDIPLVNNLLVTGCVIASSAAPRWLWDEATTSEIGAWGVFRVSGWSWGRRGQQWLHPELHRRSSKASQPKIQRRIRNFTATALKLHHRSSKTESVANVAGGPGGCTSCSACLARQPRGSESDTWP